MKRSAIVMLSLSLAAVASGEKVVDLKKLLDSGTQRVEIESMRGCQPGGPILESYRLHWCPQADKSPPLLILAASVNSSSNLTSSPYAVTRPEELFGGSQIAEGIPGPSPAITALWQEPDAKTRAWMWVCLVLHQGVQRGLMEDSYDSDKAFVARAKDAIMSVPAAERRPMIESLIVSASLEDRDEEKGWLRQLAEAP